MKAERRTMQFGTARNPASRNRLSPQPSNLEGTLSHQFVSRPGPPPIGCISFSRKDSRTAFLAHWLTVQVPSALLSATRSRPSSRASSAASTALRTAPVVAAPTASRSSHAASIVEARSARLMEMSGSKRVCPRKVAGRRRLSTRRETVSAMSAGQCGGPAASSSILFDGVTLPCSARNRSAGYKGRPCLQNPAAFRTWPCRAAGGIPGRAP